MSLSIGLALLIAFLLGMGIGRTMGESVAWERMEEREDDERTT